MNVADLQRGMEECLASFQERLPETAPDERLRLAEKAKRDIRLLCKRAKRRIDQHRRYAINERAGIEQKLERIRTAYMNAIDTAAAEQ